MIRIAGFRLLALAGDQQVQIRILQIKSLAEMKIGQGPLEQIDTAAQVYLMPYQVLKSPLFPRLQQQRHQYITDGMGGRTGKAGRNIRYAIMNYAIFNEDGILMCCDLGSLETTSPVNADINDHTARPHVAHHLVRDYDRRTAGLGRK